MNEKYTLSEEEINKIILSSPYSLDNSPSEKGLKALQIKRFFYEFIRVFAKKLNNHLSQIGETLVDYDDIVTRVISSEEAIALLEGTIIDLQKRDSELGNEISTSMSSHNTSDCAHPYILSKIATDISMHNASGGAHSDLRKVLKKLQEGLNVALALASGKSIIHAVASVEDMLDVILANEAHLGDIFLISDSSVPDFTVYEVGLSSSTEGDIEISASEVANGEASFEEDKLYYYEGTRLYASSSNLETSVFARQEALDCLEEEIKEKIEEISSLLNIHSALIDGKEEKATRLSESSEEILLQSNKEYTLGLRTSITFILPEEQEGLNTLVNFRSGATPTSITAPSEIYFVGDDCEGGVLTPYSSRVYELSLKSVCSLLICRVISFDYEVIE